MAAKARFYVVWKGRTTGIFNDWSACAAQVNGFPDARYMAFSTRREAEHAFAGEYESIAGKPASSQKRLFSPHPPIAESWVVDASCSGNPGQLEWRCVHLTSGKQLFHRGPFRNGTNNIGEFLAIVHALTLMEQRKIQLPVYSDSSTAIRWVKTGICKTKLRPNGINAPLFDLIAQAENWLADHSLQCPVLKWDTEAWGENPADFNRK